MKMDFKKELEKNLDSMILDLRGLLQIPGIAGEAEGEYLSQMLKAGRIYAEAVYRLAGE